MTCFLEQIIIEIKRWGLEEEPIVYPVLTKEGQNIGYVQLVKTEEGWEVGYHIAKQYTGNGYATEAVSICLEENVASARVMEKCGFETLFIGEGLYQNETRRIVKYIWKR